MNIKREGDTIILSMHVSDAEAFCDELEEINRFEFTLIDTVHDRLCFMNLNTPKDSDD